MVCEVDAGFVLFPGVNAQAIFEVLPAVGF